MSLQSEGSKRLARVTFFFDSKYYDTSSNIFIVCYFRGRGVFGQRDKAGQTTEILAWVTKSISQTSIKSSPTPRRDFHYYLATTFVLITTKNATIKVFSSATTKSAPSQPCPPLLSLQPTTHHAALTDLTIPPLLSSFIRAFGSPRSRSKDAVLPPIERPHLARP